MKFRWHKGGLAESLATVVEMPAANFRAWMFANAPAAYRDLQVEPYCFDHRIGWDTYIVKLDGIPVGFTDGPVPRETSSTRQA